MDETIYRKKSLERITSPEALSDYLHVTSPTVWLILGAIILLLAGILVAQWTPIPLYIAIALFASTVLFSFVTLPVEVDASRRAVAWLEGSGIVSGQQLEYAKDALKAAAYTYVVAAIGSLATLLYYIAMIFGGNRR